MSVCKKKEKLILKQSHHGILGFERMVKMTVRQYPMRGLSSDGILGCPHGAYCFFFLLFICSFSFPSLDHIIRCLSRLGRLNFPLRSTTYIALVDLRETYEVHLCVDASKSKSNQAWPTPQTWRLHIWAADEDPGSEWMPYLNPAENSLFLFFFCFTRKPRYIRAPIH